MWLIVVDLVINCHSSLAFGLAVKSGIVPLHILSAFAEATCEPAWLIIVDLVISCHSSLAFGLAVKSGIVPLHILSCCIVAFIIIIL